MSQMYNNGWKCNLTLNTSAAAVPSTIPHLYSSLNFNISCSVLNGVVSFDTVRNAIKFPQYVATITMQNNLQQLANVRPEMDSG